jgi:integrase
MKLDAKNTAGLVLGDKTDAIWFDDALPGFGYRCRRNAKDQVKATWIVQYRRAGASRRMLLGSGDVLTAAQAREKARETLALVQLGKDPQADKVDRRSADKFTLRSAVAEFLAVKAGKVRPKTLAELTRYLNGPYFKALHSMPIDVVSRKDVASQLLTMNRRHGAATSGLARGALSGFYAWAMTQGLAEANPVVGTGKPKPAAARERVLSDDELAAVWKACEDLGDYGRIIRLLTISGQRRGEVGGIAWGELDRDRDVWTIPATRTKNARQHVLPIMPAMLAILADVPRRVSRDLLFGLRGNGYTAWGDGKTALDAKLKGKIEAPWVIHDIRRSVATGMATLGVQPHIVEQILNHVSGHKAGVAGIYNKSSYEREVKIAMGLWDDHVTSIVTGGARKIIPLHS